MQFKMFLTFVLGIAAALAGCGGTTTTINVSNTNGANTAGNAAIPASNSALETTKKPEAATANNAPTLAPVVQAYYKALQTKDAALLKSVMSKEFIASVEADMKEEKKTNIAAYLAEFDKIPEKPVEVRNEKIEGNDAVAEIKGGTYVNWTPFAFINEGGKWKFTGGSPVLK
ncbi:MAG: nuclear transport factor 2 family protein [Acidobacteriota bacterium]